MTTPIALAGIGKIARDQHVPTIAASADFDLVATVTRGGGLAGVPNFRTVAEMVAAVPQVAAIGICTPPVGRLALVRDALAAGLDVLIEKPPAATLGEAEALMAAARTAGRLLCASWHSRHAAAVAPARTWLAGRTVRRVAVRWQEDVRVWHPGQAWIWEPGIGVFDPGINALSIVTALLPAPLLLRTAVLKFPANRAAPIAAMLTLDHDGVPVEANFDFDQRGPQRWDIDIDTDGGLLQLTHGAAQMSFDGVAQPVGDATEYAGVYAHFADLRRRGTSDVDLTPFRLVADAFMLGTRETVAAFDD